MTGRTLHFPFECCSGDVFSSPMADKAQDRAELFDAPISLRTVISSAPCHAGEESLKRLFEPLGYAVNAEPCSHRSTAGH
jgi:hypothetical protein